MDNQSLKNQLIAQETQTLSLKEKYQKEIQLMIEKPLPNWKRTAFVLSGFLGIFFFFFFGYVFFTIPDGFPMIASSMFVVGSIFGILWAMASFYIVKKGTMNIKKDGGVLMGIIWVMLVFMMTGYLIIGMQIEDAANGSRMILFGLVFLIMGVVFMIQHLIERSEINFKESILNLELQIAELNERLQKKDDDGLMP